MTLTRPALIPELIDFLSRASCVAVQTRRGILEVELPYPADEERARMDLGLYLAAWRGLQPEVRAEIETERRLGPGLSVPGPDASSST